MKKSEIIQQLTDLGVDFDLNDDKENLRGLLALKTGIPVEVEEDVINEDVIKEDIIEEEPIVYSDTPAPIIEAQLLENTELLSNEKIVLDSKGRKLIEVMTPDGSTYHKLDADGNMIVL